MFHVEHGPALTGGVDIAILAPPRQWQSEVPTRKCCLRHFTCKCKFCQVFFAGAEQICAKVTGLLAPARRLYSSAPTMSSTFYPFCANSRKPRSWLRAPLYQQCNYDVKYFLGQLYQIMQLTVFAGSVKIMGDLVGKFTKIFANCSK